MRIVANRAMMEAQLLLIQRCVRKGITVTAVFAVMIGFIFGFIVAEIAQRYFEIDLPTYF